MISNRYKSEPDGQEIRNDARAGSSVCTRFLEGEVNHVVRERVDKGIQGCSITCSTEGNQPIEWEVTAPQ